MSTRSSLAGGDNFHLYTDLADPMSEEGNIYLRLNKVEYEASSNEVTVCIPAAVWETIRKLPSMVFSFADLTDQDLLERVEKEVDERIQEYEKAEDRMKGLYNVFGCAVFGAAEEPREHQIAAGLEYFKLTRARQQEVRQEMTTHRIYNRVPE